MFNECLHFTTSLSEFCSVVLKHLEFLLVGGVSRGQVLQLINGDPNVTKKQTHL